MSQVIKLSRGLNINLKGKAREEVHQIEPNTTYRIYPSDYVGFSAKVTVKPGDFILAGEPVLFDKNRPDIKVVSPVSGTIQAVNRGEKRRLLNIEIKAKEKNEYKNFGNKNPRNLSPETIKSILADSGLLALIRRRPYDVVADIIDEPRDIFISGFYSAPLAPNSDFIIKNQEVDFQSGLDALSVITKGKVYLGISNTTTSAALAKAQNAEIITFDGPHPAGNVGVQINHINPINKGEVVWTLNLETVLYIGRLFNHGIVDLRRLVAFTGSEVNESARVYYNLLPGTSIKEIIQGKTTKGLELRYISGDVLTGEKISQDGYLHAHHNQVTVIPEGIDKNDFIGWIMPGIDKFSTSKTYPSFIFNLLKKREYTIDARIQGGKRAMIMSNEWDKVFPMDILPEFLIRAIIAMDIDKMENLGIYEVAPEDFALCEFVDTSKMELQKIVREGLNWLYREMQ
ncbi:Na(+)-translocating NADH-quinone reductase subunit A [Bacteroidales bacterium OttesenSCG-928-M11]|nr:Na(+)-translocating NADH-quinone reductase subunit A [Bacteroidales bacterium OttesenSCG-928-M11]